MKLQNVALYILFLTGFISCIALEDDFSPSISSDSFLNDTYYYKDSFQLNITFTDNVLIEEAQVTIGKVDASLDSTDLEFTFDSVFTTQARLLILDSAILIPAYVSTGEYFLALRNTDTGGNIIADTTYFMVGTDTLSPSLSDLTVMSAIEGNQENTAYCRGEYLALSGLISDNIGINKVGVQIGTSSPRYFLADGENITLESIVENQIFISDSLANGVYDLTISMEDVFGNVKTEVQSINVNCDDVPAQFVSYAETNGIEIPSDRVVLMFPGENFSLSSLIFEDEGGLDSMRLEVSYISVPSAVGSAGTVVEAPVVNLALDGATTVDLATLTTFNFGFNQTGVDAGETIFVNVKVKDQEQTWDNASFFRFSLVAREDLAPSINITDLIFNESKEYIPENTVQELTLTEDLNISIEGKVDENVGLSSITYTFTDDYGYNAPMTSTFTDFTTYPVDLGVMFGNVSFPIRQSLDHEGVLIYTLEVVATDIKGQVDTVTYNFSVNYSQPGR
ncbi:hypothetical protein EI427_15995 [Flammeovirga pectinis]|uniref:Cadherin domain-containing protein n=1 Tax=Flammeovirga pectinis TaxID=2494373 RepID=A0A3S9P638_9BACT|nr:DUF4625 domain-containing protein [Flammeovirga pectinis]AZQ63671.1 hypothetical protein EI427_15995 [Flammeovirga pectinis]